MAWDFGDTLCDERFMRQGPERAPGWAANHAFDAVLTEGGRDRAWNLGQIGMNDLVGPLSERLGLPRAIVARRLRSCWRGIVWFEEAHRWLRELDGVVPQVVVTVNPHEFHGIAAACGLDVMVDLIVTSAEVGSESKVRQVDVARSCLDLAPGIERTLLIDNKQANIDEFVRAGGQGHCFDVESRGSLSRLLGQLTPITAAP